MRIEYFIRNYTIQAGDAIVVKKQAFRILDHYVIYLGIGKNNTHEFIAYFSDGIKKVSEIELSKYLTQFYPVRINKFIGSETDRLKAVKRALSRLDEKAYHLILNNCEHFANWVQKRIPQSSQVNTFGKVVATVGAGMSIYGATEKDAKLTGAGALITILGAILTKASTQENRICR